MQIVRTNSFILDSITYGGREEHYCTREQITPELIADIKRDIIEGKVFFVLAQTEDETEDQFQLEINKGLHGEKWLEIYIEHTDAEKIEHIFMYCDEKYIKHKRDFEGQKELVCQQFRLAHHHQQPFPKKDLKENMQNRYVSLFYVLF